MIKILGCGDLFISKLLPEKGYEKMDELVSLMASYDVRFGNLETTIHDNEGYPSCYPGGGWAMASPQCLKDIKSYGFNILSIANNHIMDYSHKGLEATVKYLKQEAITYVGAGMNLTEAALPVYVECREGRVAFIAVTSSFHDSDAAGMWGGVIPGRPGVNPLRHKEIYQVVPDLYDQLKQFIDETGINDTYKWSMQNGYMSPQKDLFLRNMLFQKGEENRKISYPLKADIDRIVKNIKEASIQADYTVLSIHSHQMKGNDEIPDDFVVQFCHECIDAGADAILGTGSHVLRGIEVYKGKIIFYGLGDFILQNEMVKALPYEFYEKYSVDNAYYNLVGMGMNARSENETKGLSANLKAWESIMAGIQIDDDKMTITLYPIDLNYEKGRTRRGWPCMTFDSGIVERVAEISKREYGTEIILHEGLGKIYC